MNIFRNNSKVNSPIVTERNSFNSKFRHVKRAIFLTLALTVLPACNFNKETPKDLGNVTTREVLNHTDQLIGKTVTIRSEPIGKVGPASFTLNDPRLFGNDPVLIINATGKKFDLPADSSADVQVTGIVRRFAFAEVEREYNLNLDKKSYLGYENKPVIIAKSMAPAPDPGEITQNPQRYYNKRLAVTGEVENIRNTNLFTLDEDKLFGGEDLLVLNLGSQQVSVKEDETVAVTGVVRPFLVAEFERDYDLTWDLKIREGLEAEYKNKPVLVAEGVYPSAIPESEK